MATGEVVLLGFFQVLFDKLASRDVLVFARQEKVDSELKNWRKGLQVVNSVLVDAEERQLTDGDVKIWLRNLQDLAYDMEDILDEFSTEELGRKLMAQSRERSSKFRNFSSASFSSWSPDAFKFNISMGSKVKGITRRLDELCRERRDFQLREAAASSWTRRAVGRPPSTSLQIEPVVYGRDEDKDKILATVLSDEPSNANFDVIAIVGTGGVGKTTLAREVYNHRATLGFDIKAWVCVSDEFDVLRISKSILESITSSSCDLQNMNQVQTQLKDAVVGKKFLVFLDDVWSEDDHKWEVLRSPFLYGAPGSKIVVTTRSTKVALTMGCPTYYELNLLSDEACWSVFMSHAAIIGPREKCLDLIRKEVVEKCKGLPLAATTLGGLLRFRKYDEWEPILDSKLWGLSAVNSEILPALRLSYYHLPSYLKRCFAYCSIFPKDYEFEEEELVLLWIANGLIPFTENMHWEDRGRDYFRELQSRSFFQRSSSYNNSKFVMHDLINDLAQSVSGETIFRLEGHNHSGGFQRARHASYICGACDGKRKFEVFYDAECLRTFLPIPVSDHTPYITNAVISDLLPKLKKLRVLSLRKYCITELPNSIGGLRHLTYLNLSGTMIKSLPESVSSLFNLQILLLKDCLCLRKLPPDMGNLISLLHLDIKNVKLSEMPLRMGELKYLERLSNFIVGKGLGSQVKDLMELKFLRGELCISGLENVINLESRILSDKRNLDVLQLEWESHFDDSRNETIEKDVLGMLRPHSNIKTLIIKFYGGIGFPSWVGDPSFSNMVFLRLENCEKCKFLPSLGLLPSLRNLCIKGMTRLERISFEIFGISSKSFQSLEILHFEDLQEWKQWDPATEDDEQVERFPCLRELSIIDCPKLTGTLPNDLPLLDKLVIRECENMLVSVSNFPMLCELEVDGSRRVLCSHPIDFKSVKSMTLSNILDFGNWSMQGFQKVEHLKVVGCEKLIYLWQNEFCLEKPTPGMHSLAFLRELSIENCPSLVSFPEADLFSLLSVLKIENCNSLKYLPVVMKNNKARLHSLRIKECDSLTCIVKGQLPSSLMQLSVISCKKLQCVLDNREDNRTSSASPFSSVMHEENIDSTSPSVLEYLYIFDCPSLTCLSSRGQLPASLKHLGIRGCRELTTLSERGQLPATLKHIEISGCSALTNLSSGGLLPETLQHLNIADCRNLVSVAKGFHNNRSLEFLLIRNCNSLESIPEGLHNLRSLRSIYIWNCPSLLSFPEAGLPNTSLGIVSIERCKKVEALPNHMHNLNSLKELVIWGCPSIRSFPEHGFPTNLTTLSISDPNIYKSLLHWGFHQLSSLKSLEIRGCPDAESFPQEEMGMMLPTTLTRLTINGFPKLKYLSSVGFVSLSWLEDLSISDCPELKSFPKVGLPCSLLQLYISGCPLLKKRCKRGKGKFWSMIKDIPRVRIDSKFIYDPQ
ncbi:hypothetical protein ACOSP7_030020 [Xanthoceras sorbifolium]